MQVTERSVQRIGQSLLVTLPRDWTKALGIKKGMKLKLAVAGNGSLTIAPEISNNEQHRECVIPYDVHFERRFFREYFAGNERITVLFGTASVPNKKAAHLFLGRFMNLQILEDTQRHLVIKCFRINELSILECLQRMHLLTMNVFSEIMSGNSQLQDLRDSLSRFYYMLVMQIRRFLEEGKFAEENQISIITAMDIRMVAERIQRIAEVLFSIRSSDRATLHKLGAVKEYYASSFTSFHDANFDKALLLWAKGNALMETMSAANNDIKCIVRYAREISMLVR